MKPITNFIITIVILVVVVSILLLVWYGPLALTPGHGAQIRSAKGLEGTTTVIIENNTFNPTYLTVLAGTTVVWKNPSGSAQVNSVMSDKIVNGSRLFASGPINAGQSFIFTFTDVGNYTYSSGIQYFANGSVNVIPNAPEGFPTIGQITPNQGFPTLAMRAG